MNEQTEHTPLLIALNAALNAATHLGWWTAMKEIAVDTGMKTQMTELAAEAEKNRDAAMRIVVRQLTDDGFRL